MNVMPSITDNPIGFLNYIEGGSFGIHSENKTSSQRSTSSTSYQSDGYSSQGSSPSSSSTNKQRSAGSYRSGNSQPNLINMGLNILDSLGAKGHTSTGTSVSTKGTSGKGQFNVDTPFGSVSGKGSYVAGRASAYAKANAGIDKNGAYANAGVGFDLLAFEGKGEVKGKLFGTEFSAKGSVRVGINGHAQAGVRLNSDGLYAQASAGVTAYAAADGEVKIGDNFHAVGTAYAKAGAEASASAGLSFKNGLNAELNARAFAGVEASAKGSVEINGVKLRGQIGVKLGVGAEVNLKAGFKDGKLNVKFNLGVALGIGINIGFDISIDVNKIGKAIGDFFGGLFGGGKKGGDTIQKGMAGLGALSKMFSQPSSSPFGTKTDNTNQTDDKKVDDKDDKKVDDKEITPPPIDDKDVEQLKTSANENSDKLQFAF
ncbi:MAG TPA: hypothetical protein DCE42_08580 [Myxococcales bacterium]|nr:hypothetical protein [Deltaproteobacteria bacterium]MBU49168.1 hypothetical protein [Deltaproteobacteria bacterium]HAA54801.1 hypothetical protein [Myxococcales bacterium]|tara:strand:- start:21927 stop:23213 length:1287 start_codon:yes stop_codon:yes gene_type:complete